MMFLEIAGLAKMTKLTIEMPTLKQHLKSKRPKQKLRIGQINSCRKVDRLIESGVDKVEACRRCEVSLATYCRYKKARR